MPKNGVCGSQRVGASTFPYYSLEPFDFLSGEGDEEFLFVAFGTEEPYETGVTGEVGFDFFESFVFFAGDGVMLVGLLADSFFDAFVAVEFGLLLFADVALHATAAMSKQTSGLEVMGAADHRRTVRFGGKSLRL